MTGVVLERLPPRTVSLAAAHVGGQGLAVLTAAVLTRRLGAPGFGVYAFVIATVFVVNVATTFGSDMVLIREIAGGGPIERCVAALAMQLALSVVAIVAVYAVSAFVPESAGRYVTPVRIYSLALVPASFFSVATALLRGLAMLRAYALVVVAAAAMPLVAVAGIVRAGDGPAGTMAVLLVAQVVIAAIAVGCCVAPWRRLSGRATERRPRHLAVRAVEMARTTRTVGGLGVLGVLYQRLGVFGVAAAAGPASTGWYSGATRVVDASKVGHLALATATYPVMSAPQSADRADVVGRARQVNVGAAVAVAIAVAVSAPLVLDRLYGPGFEPSTRALMVAAVSLVPSCIATFESLQLFADRREADVLRAVLVSIGVLVVGLAVLLPLLGMIGACWAMVSADTTQAVMLTRCRARSRR